MILDRFLSLVARFGVEDRVLAIFMLAGPALILVFILAGRSAGTIAIGTMYICVFVFYVVYKGIQRGTE